MPPYLPSAIAAGFLSGALFFVAAVLGLGFLFMFLPTLPLLSVGLANHPKATLAASLPACALVALMGGFSTGLFFLIVFALPSYYLVAQALKRSADGEWYPMGRIFLNLTAGACVMMALVTLHYAAQPGGIEQELSKHMQAEFAGMEGDGEYGEIVHRLTTNWAFFIFALTIWLWNLCLYLHAWIATRLLARSQRAIRPGMAIELFAMPGWILPLLAIAGLASLIGSPAMAFMGKLCFIALLFPYFALGIALMHDASKNWPSRGFFLFFIYLMIVAQFWPALIVTAMGVFYHIKRLSGAPTSSKS